jgi:Cft2 family RNA processing exonuclease
MPFGELPNAGKRIVVSLSPSAMPASPTTGSQGILMKHTKLIHHGAREGVTGSCHQLWMDDTTSILIDCGQFQGADEGQHNDDEQGLDFSIDGIKALIVTHVHIDHVGRIPNLLAAAFDGPILCSEPSARLLPIVLEDAFRLSISRDREQLERYSRSSNNESSPCPMTTGLPCTKRMRVNAKCA